MYYVHLPYFLSLGFFTSEKQTPLLISEPVILRQNSGRRNKGQMTTFGKGRPAAKPDIEHSVKRYLSDSQPDGRPNQKQRQEQFQRSPGKKNRIKIPKIEKKTFRH